MARSAAVQRLDALFSDLAQERRSHEKRWKDVADFVDPTTARFSKTDANKGNRSRSKILDSTATDAHRVMTAGLLAGLANPGTPWFELRVPDKSLSESGPVQEWLRRFRDAILDVFDRSNLYAQLGMLLRDETGPGTSPMAIFEHPHKVIRCETFPTGSYYLAQNGEGAVDTIGREVTMTVRQMANRFGPESISDWARANLSNQRPSASVAVRHLIMPNPDADPSRLSSVFLPWFEVYWEGPVAGHKDTDTPNWGAHGAGGGAMGGILGRGGYHEFPVVVGRWGRNNDDVYATDSPSLMALGDVKGLQRMERTALNGAGKWVNPPLRASPELEGQPVSLQEGDITYDPEIPSGRKGVEALHDVQPAAFQYLEVKQEQIRQRIHRAYMTDLFLMLLRDARAQPPTAEEIRARIREKSEILGPILERHSDEVFDPLIDRTAAIMLRRSLPDWEQGRDGLVPRPPSDLEGVDVRPEYVSEVARALRMATLAPLEGHVAFSLGVAEVVPDVLDITDWDEVMRQHALGSGTSPRLLNSPEMVAAIRQRRAEAQQAQAAVQEAEMAAKVARDLGSAQVGDGNALEAVTGAR